MSYRIGFASIDGTRVDEHFASARYWQIYDIEDQSADFVETRKTAPRLQGHCDGEFEYIAELLDDCDAVFVLRIGESAAAYMIGKGKRVFEAEGEIEEILAELSDESLLDSL